MTSPVAGSAFIRPRTVRAASAVGSVGALVGISLFAATPAFAVSPPTRSDTDCDDTNTASTNSGIQDLLTAGEPLICVDGTVPITTTLTFDYDDLVLHGINGGTLDGQGNTQILFDTGRGSGSINDLVVENLTFANGYLASDDGAAIFGSYITVVNSTFLNNSAADDGGAIEAYGVNVYGSLFDNNGAGDEGGAIRAEDFVYVETSTFYYNGAGSTGGAIHSWGSTEVHQSTFDQNGANDAGGAIFSEGYTFLENSTFNQNGAEVGGAVAADYGLINQNTFYESDSSETGGHSIFKFGSVEGGLSINGNIFAGENETGGQEQLAKSSEVGTGDIVDLGGNLFTTESESALTSPQASTGFAVTKTALFGGNTLAPNGGPTDTIALPDGSIAIDYVPETDNTLDVDQRDFPRTTLNDAGAYEHQNPAPALAATGSEVSVGTVGLSALLLAAGAGILLLGRRVARAAR